MKTTMIDKSFEECYQKYYNELLSIWQNQEYRPLIADKTEIFLQNTVLYNFLQQSPCVSYIFNLQSLKFDLVSANTKEIFGYDPELFKERGLDFCNHVKHPEDLSRTWKLLKKVWDYIMNINPSERQHYKFNYDYRVLKPNLEEVRILEQNMIFQQDCQGNITHILGTCIDITGWKKSNNQLASVVSKDRSILFFTPSDDNVKHTILSKRELEILKLLAQGFSSKYVANKLYISFHTVNTHRQNMIQKTGTKNTSELVDFALSNGLI